MGLAVAVAASAVVTALVLPAGAGAGLAANLLLYDHDAIPIPNGHGAAKMSFDVPPSTKMVGAVRPNFRIKHHRTQQLKLLVKGPSGESVLLSEGETRGENLGSGHCGEDPDLVGYAGFEDSASQGLEAGSPPFTGYWLPNDPLSALAGDSPQGRWTLIAKDTNPAGEKGKLLCGLIVLALPPR